MILYFKKKKVRCAGELCCKPVRESCHSTCCNSIYSFSLSLSHQTPIHALGLLLESLGMSTSLHTLCCHHCPPGQLVVFLTFLHTPTHFRHPTACVSSVKPKFHCVVFFFGTLKYCPWDNHQIPDLDSDDHGDFAPVDVSIPSFSQLFQHPPPCAAPVCLLHELLKILSLPGTSFLSSPARAHSPGGVQTPLMSSHCTCPNHFHIRHEMQADFELPEDTALFIFILQTSD